MERDRPLQSLMKESRESHQRRVCDTCGDVGFEETITTCSKCSIRRHGYCMEVVMMEVPEDWVCEECLPENDMDSLKYVLRENVPNSSKNVSFTLERQAGSKRLKAVKTGKVKFLPAEEAIKLSSGSLKKASPIKSNFRTKPLPTNFTPSVSKSTSMGSKTVNPYISPMKMISSSKYLHLGSRNPIRHDGVRISSSTTQHAVKAPNVSKEDEEKARQTPANHSNETPKFLASKEVETVNAKAMSITKETLNTAASATSVLCSSIINTEVALVPNKDNACNRLTLDIIQPDKELSTLHTKTDESVRSSRPSPSRPHTTVVGSENAFSAGNGQDAAEPENYNTAEKETQIRLKLSLYRRHFPAVQTIWTGVFKFVDKATPDEFYGGFLAQPPCTIHCKAYELLQKMPPILEVNLLHRCHLQADLFQNGCLELCDIALYIFPVNNMERSLKNYNQLFQLMEIKSSVMVSYMDGVELLIFTSKQLHVDSRDVFTRSNTEFFCGVFCHAKDNQLKTHQKRSSVSFGLYE